MDRVGPRNDFGSVAERLADHGIKVEPQVGGVLVRLKQPLRGLIAPLLDANAVLPMITTAQRRYSCPAIPSTVGGTVPATLALTVGAGRHVRRVQAGRGRQLRRLDDRERDLHRR